MNVQQVTDEMRRRGFTARAIRLFFGMYDTNQRVLPEYQATHTA